MINSIKRVIIHIGMTKTGSTALQNFLFYNKNNLESDNILFPETGLHINLDLRPGRTAGHQSLLINRIRQDKENVIDELNKEISQKKNNKIDTLVMSAENLFHTADEKLIKDIYNIYNRNSINIIVYLRRQDCWVESIYNEAISGGHARETRKFNKFLKYRIDKGYLDYYNILSKWSDIFGIDNIIIRGYEKALHNGGVIKDFCKITGININDNYAIPLPNLSNHTYLSKEKIEFLRNVNYIPFDDIGVVYKEYMDRLVLYIQSKNITKKPVWMKRRHRKKLLKVLRKSNHKIIKKFKLNHELFPSIEDYCPEYIDCSNSIPLNHACKALKLLQEMKK